MKKAKVGEVDKRTCRKIEAIIPGSQEGFFSTFRRTIETMYHLDLSDQCFYVKWDTGPYMAKWLHGRNVWDYFFFQPYPVRPSVFSRPRAQEYRRIEKTMPDYRRVCAETIRTFVQFNEKTRALIEGRWGKAFQEGERVLGVHFRGTDKKRHRDEIRHGGFARVGEYITATHRVLETGKFDKVFLATDDSEGIDAFTRDFPRHIVYRQSSIRSSGSQGTHVATTGGGYVKALDVITDMVFLSKSRFLIKGTSNVSFTSLLFNSELPHYNLTLRRNGDLREGMIEDVDVYDRNFSNVLEAAISRESTHSGCGLVFHG